VLATSYAIYGGGQTPALARPDNDRDDEDRRANEAFCSLLNALRRNRTALANALAEDLARDGYGVERVGTAGFRMIPPPRRDGRLS
jgi:hypothetical protein